MDQMNEIAGFSAGLYGSDRGAAFYYLEKIYSISKIQILFEGNCLFHGFDFSLRMCPAVTDIWAPAS